MVELGRDPAATAFAPRDEFVDIVRIRAARVLADARQRRREAAGIVTRVLCHEPMTVVVAGPGAATRCRTPVVRSSTPSGSRSRPSSPAGLHDRARKNRGGLACS